MAVGMGRIRSRSRSNWTGQVALCFDNFIQRVLVVCASVTLQCSSSAQAPHRGGHDRGSVGGEVGVSRRHLRRTSQVLHTHLLL